ncbi:hypothetical protein EYZ11_010448 [Aspergillus tanneri]|uniref:Uncharacterized protein n=1 Tax=Aspergillus tanneri TaxID=1220188 RepID=A0A4S3J5D1_9EURO|nr:hypothetical protein EYZ11_010448 [Aspergillus tanneri]
MTSLRFVREPMVPDVYLRMRVLYPILEETKNKFVHWLAHFDVAVLRHTTVAHNASIHWSHSVGLRGPGQEQEADFELHLHFLGPGQTKLCFVTPGCKRWETILDSYDIHQKMDDLNNKVRLGAAALHAGHIDVAGFLRQVAFGRKPRGSPTEVRAVRSKKDALERIQNLGADQITLPDLALEAISLYKDNGSLFWRYGIPSKLRSIVQH